MWNPLVWKADCISAVERDSWGECERMPRLEKGLSGCHAGFHNQLDNVSCGHPPPPFPVPAAPEPGQICPWKQQKGWGCHPELQLLREGVGVCVWKACWPSLLCMGVSGLRICNRRDHDVTLRQPRRGGGRKPCVCLFSPDVTWISTC